MCDFKSSEYEPLAERIKTESDGTLDNFIRIISDKIENFKCSCCREMLLRLLSGGIPKRYYKKIEKYFSTLEKI